MCTKIFGKNLALFDFVKKYLLGNEDVLFFGNVFSVWPNCFHKLGLCLRFFLSPGSEHHDPRTLKRKVTMVGWSLNDQYCILACDGDNVMRVFDSIDGRLVFELQGHTDAVYVLENHPFDTNVYLTAGHDAKLILWSLLDGTSLQSFQQWVPGHGASPFVDAKWSPDGTMIAAVDMFGSLNVYGPGSAAAYARTPDEQFFHTDFRPLMKDARGFVVDEQTVLAPNMMQPPFLVNSHGVPYPADDQRFVPGRRNNAEQVGTKQGPFMSRLIHWFIHSLIHSFIHWFVDWSIDWLIDWLFGRLIDLLIGCLVGWLVDWLIDSTAHKIQESLENSKVW